MNLLKLVRYAALFVILAASMTVQVQKASAMDCAQENEGCGIGGIECCYPLECLSGVCGYQSPGCGSSGDSCGGGGCCGLLVCCGGVCQENCGSPGCGGGCMSDSDCGIYCSCIGAIIRGDGLPNTPGYCN